MAKMKWTYSICTELWWQKINTYQIVRISVKIGKNAVVYDIFIGLTTTAFIEYWTIDL